MVMTDPDRIDTVLKSPEGEIVLMISEHRDWRIYPKMKEQLRRKISTYVKFIRSDDFKRRFGIRKVKILLMTSHEPTEKIKQDLTEYQEATGIETEYRTVSIGRPF